MVAAHRRGHRRHHRGVAGVAFDETAAAPDWAFFSTATRLWELGAGALLATALGPLGRIPVAVKPVLSWLGVALIGASFVLIDAQSGFPAPWALLPVAGTLLVLAAGVDGEPLFQVLLGNRVSAYLGDLSYSLYLVHWPVIVLLATLMSTSAHYYLGRAGADLRAGPGAPPSRRGAAARRQPGADPPGSPRPAARASADRTIHQGRRGGGVDPAGRQPDHLRPATRRLPLTRGPRCAAPLRYRGPMIQPIRRVAVLLLLVSCLSSLIACSRDESGSDTASSASPTSSTAPEDYQQIPGTRVSLRPTAGLQLDPSLPGLARPGSLTSVVVVDQQQSTGQSPDQVLAEIDASFRDQERASRDGLQLSEPRRTEIAGFPAVVVSGTQNRAGVVFLKVLAALAPPDSFVTITGTAEQTGPITADQLIGLISDARWSNQRAPSDLGITVTPSAGYQEVPSGGSLQLSLGGQTGPDVPVFLASPSRGFGNAVPPQARRQFAERRFVQLPGNPAPGAGHRHHHRGAARRRDRRRVGRRNHLCRHGFHR